MNKRGFQLGHTINLGRKRSAETRQRMIDSWAGIRRIKQFNGKWHAKACLVCENEFQCYVSPSKSLEEYKYCSRVCKDKNMLGRKVHITKHSKESKEKMSMAHLGIKNKKEWGGFRNNSGRLERAKFRRTMQKLIFERDDYTCQLCEVRGVDLQVDHIQSWADYVELRFSMDNCRTLCASCHYKITFGKPMPKKIKGWGHNLLKEGT